jgi:hypothetical protein
VDQESDAESKHGSEQRFGFLLERPVRFFPRFRVSTLMRSIRSILRRKRLERPVRFEATLQGVGQRQLFDCVHTRSSDDGSTAQFLQRQNCIERERERERERIKRVSLLIRSHAFTCRCFVATTCPFRCVAVRFVTVRRNFRECCSCTADSLQKMTCYASVHNFRPTERSLDA